MHILQASIASIRLQLQLQMCFTCCWVGTVNNVVALCIVHDQKAHHQKLLSSFSDCTCGMLHHHLIQLYLQAAEEEKLNLQAAEEEKRDIDQRDILVTPTAS